MNQVIEINDARDLAGYRLLWSALLPQTRGATFFQSLDWLEVYWRHFAGEQRLRVLVVHSGNQPIGIVPLVVRRERTRLGWLRTLTYPLDDWGTFFGPIGPNPAATLVLAVRHLADTPRDWDQLDFRWVDDAADAGRTLAACAQHGLHPVRGHWRTVAQIVLAGTWESYWAARTSRWRNNVRRSEKRLRSRGDVEYLRYRPAGAASGDDDPRWDLFEACLGVAGRSWQAASTSGTTLTHAAVVEFLSDAHQVAARAGALDLNLLYVAGRPVAFNYAYHYRGHVAGLRTGFDAAWAHDGPGSVLQMYTIRDSFARGDELYDLGADYLAAKRYWHTRLALACRYTCFAHRPRPQLLRLKRLLVG